MQEADPKIVEMLKQYADQGLTFYQAKEALLKQGYQDAAIEQAADQYQYGSKPKPPDPATAAFAKDPQDAERVAQTILKDDKKEREEVAIVDGVAGQYAPDLQSDVKYQNKFLSDIGMSWWTWLIIEGAITAIIIYFKLPQYLFGIVALILVIVLAVKRA
ncbi:MAG TPA: hypothetical protein VK712_00160 [Verrucomicrobiae bacterium]|jgi:hypothetical protein|nr:hypothetical protein [Verrucomicrobiae bacterium]